MTTHLIHIFFFKDVNRMGCHPIIILQNNITTEWYLIHITFWKKKNVYNILFFSVSPTSPISMAVLLLLILSLLSWNFAASHSTMRFLPWFQGPLPFLLQTGYANHNSPFRSRLSIFDWKLLMELESSMWKWVKVKQRRMHNCSTILFGEIIILDRNPLP